jgi:DNA-binding CsgD family transcriptional regulator
MKTLTHQPKLPAGLVDNKSVEIFAYHGEAYALFNGRTISFWDLPATIIDYYRREMESKKHLVRMFNLHKIEDQEERLEKYVIHCYGKFDNIADFDGKISHSELDFNEACASFNLTEREKEVISLIAMGFPRKLVADRLCISYYTVQNHCNSILKKIHGYNAADMTRFVVERNMC